MRLFFDPRDKAWVAVSDELPGCSAGGSTPVEALQEFEIALEAWLEALKAVGKPMPKLRLITTRKQLFGLYKRINNTKI